VYYITVKVGVQDNDVSDTLRATIHPRNFHESPQTPSAGSCSSRRSSGRGRGGAGHDHGVHFGDLGGQRLPTSLQSGQALFVAESGVEFETRNMAQDIDWYRSTVDPITRPLQNFARDRSPSRPIFPHLVARVRRQRCYEH